MTEPTEEARKLIKHVDRYLVGCLDEEAKDAWTLAVARATREGQPLHEAIKRICKGYLDAPAKAQWRR